MRTTFWGAIGLVALGCASHPPPEEHIASSMAALRGAEEAGALQVPEAALHMKLAEEQIDRAKALLGKDNLRAEDLALRAYQDAELAIALAREKQAEQRLEAVAHAGQTAGGEVIPVQAPSEGAAGTQYAPAPVPGAASGQE